MAQKRKLSDEAEREREVYRCAFCGKFTGRDTEPFYGLEDRSNDCAPVVPFCNEAHEEANHRRNVKREYDKYFIYTAPKLPA
jgi:hypothetical protein